jgi:formylmethanofuran dehydrogenase subunit B
MPRKKVVVLPKDFPRDIKAVPCPACNGYCDEVEILVGEIELYDCGKGYQCCSKAFKCRRCKTRVIVKLEAPEVDFSYD